MDFPLSELTGTLLSQARKPGEVSVFMWMGSGVIPDMARWRVCEPNIELLAARCQPLTPFASGVYMCYCSGHQAGQTSHRDRISRVILFHLQRNSANTLVIIIDGDLNQCILSSYLPSFRQFIAYPTPKDNTIDPCYCNVMDGFSSRALPPLGWSDHNLVLFTAKFTPAGIEAARSHPIRTCCVPVTHVVWSGLTGLLFRKRTMMWTVYRIRSPALFIFLWKRLSHVKPRHVFLTTSLGLPVRWKQLSVEKKAALVNRDKDPDCSCTERTETRHQAGKEKL